MVKSTSELKVGQLYYFLWSLERDLKNPIIETYCYVGKDLEVDDIETKNNIFYFQDADSFLNKGPFTEIEEKEKYKILTIEENSLSLFNNLNDLLESLLKTKGTG